MQPTLAIPLQAHRRPSPRRTAEARAFCTWLVCWIVLPNLPYLPITLMGGPPRFSEILVCGIVGLVVRRAPYWLRVMAYFGLVAHLLISFIARMFNMAVAMIASVIGLMFDLNLAASPEYLGGAALLTVTCVLALWLLRRPADLSGTAWTAAAVAATLTFAAADFALSRDTMGSYTRLAPEDAPFTSASSQADLLKLADGRTNVMLVVVEAMGQPTDPALRRKLAAMWDRPELADRFEIMHGETAFYGSTTSGEVRELCGRWGNYPEILQDDPGCLPAVLAKRGYRTTSYHSFVSDFFDRERWYPLIGIQHSVFGPELVARGAQVCKNVFPGACDRDVAGLLAKELAQANGPQFVYWLTLNSHLPVVANRQLGTENCRQLGPALDEELPMVCRLFALWQQTADALMAEVSRPDFPPTHILIVGDHMPPFTHQGSRLQFDPAHVPWVLLRYKDTQSLSASRAAK
jgi:hypothetical protein